MHRRVPRSGGPAQAADDRLTVALGIPVLLDEPETMSVSRKRESQAPTLVGGIYQIAPILCDSVSVRSFVRSFVTLRIHPGKHGASNGLRVVLGVTRRAEFNGTIADW